MAPMNLSTEQTQTHRENRCVVAEAAGEGVGWTGSLGSVDANCDTENGSDMRSCCPAQGTLSSLLGETRMEERV